MLGSASGEPQRSNYEVLREHLASRVLQAFDGSDRGKGRAKGRRLKRRRNKSVTGKSLANVETKTPEETEQAQTDNDLEEFISYLASQIFNSFPEATQRLSLSTVEGGAAIREQFQEPRSDTNLDILVSCVPAEVVESLTTYGVIETSSDVSTFLEPVFSSYTSAILSNTEKDTLEIPRSEGCELCARTWIPLTAHHLVPREAAEKAIKRGWANEKETGDIAWLCRACHSFVHHCASNEELARAWKTVDSLAAREDVGKWVKWIGSVRWMSR